jgi:LemA protein
MLAIRIEPLEAIAKWRSAVGGTSYEEVRLGAENQLTGALRHFVHLAEQDPKLCASGEYQVLAQAVESVEELIANARRRYNDATRDYNQRIATFPGNLLALLLGLQPKPYLDLLPEEQDRSAAPESFKAS